MGDDMQMNTPTMYLPADMKVTELLELSSNIGSTILTVEGNLFLQTANGGRIALKVEKERKKIDDAFDTHPPIIKKASVQRAGYLPGEDDLPEMDR